MEGDYSIGPGKARNKILCILSAFTYLAISNKKTLSCMSFLIPHVVKPSFLFPVPHSSLFQVLPSPLILPSPFQLNSQSLCKEREIVLHPSSALGISKCLWTLDLLISGTVALALVLSDAEDAAQLCTLSFPSPSCPISAWVSDPSLSVI